MADVQGTIFNVQRFSIHDGPGIRTLIFIKGCPLKCRWCSNPESIPSGLNMMSDTSVCISCGMCAKVCPDNAIFQKADNTYDIDRNKCTNCLKCAKMCPSNSKHISGELKTVDDILKIIEKDSKFYNSSGGGVTVGGGELLTQPEFAYEILRGCKERGIDTAIETSGFGNYPWLLKIAGQTNTIFFDIKAVRESRHKEITGMSNNVILNNLKWLSAAINTWGERKPRLILRLPLVKGYNNSADDMEAIADFILSELDYYTMLEILPFHNFGEKKYQELGLQYEFEHCPNSRKEDLAGAIDILENTELRLKLPRW
ncbi:MAG: glycyl-radical enzyme activating protein [Lachnospiraceae bacterium]